MARTMSSMERSWRLFTASWDVLRADGELLVLPLLSGLASVALTAAFVGFAIKADMFEAMEQGSETLPLSGYALLFLFYVVQYFVLTFFNAALVGAALDRLVGRNPTLGSALALAGSRAGAILGYAVVSATFGMVLRFLSERLGLIGRLIGAGAGLAWTASTFLVVPLLAYEGLGPFAAIGRSAMLLKTTWGESIIGTAGVSLVTSIAAMIVMAVGVGGTLALSHGGHDALAALVAGTAGALFLIIVLVGTALSGIYAASVYYYAIAGEPPYGFEPGLIEDAFEAKPA